MRLIALPVAVLLTVGCNDAPDLSVVPAVAKKSLYADSDAGFESFIRDLVCAHARRIGVQGRMHDLLIPEDSEWFIRVFGPTNGPLLDFQYRNQLSWQFSRLYTYLPLFGCGQNLLVGTDYGERGHVTPVVSDSELIPFANQPLKIYLGSIATDEEGPWLMVGSFVYVNGNFRYLARSAHYDA